MSDSTIRFAKRENVQPTAITIVIHTKKNKEGKVDYMPQYFYKVNGKPKKDEKGNVMMLDFCLDFLDSSMDFLNREGTAAVFLSDKFKSYEMFYEEKKYSAINLYIAIKPKTESVEDFDVKLYHFSEKIADLSLAEIFES